LLGIGSTGYRRHHARAGKQGGQGYSRRREFCGFPHRHSSYHYFHEFFGSTVYGVVLRFPLDSGTCPVTLRNLQLTQIWVKRQA